MAAEPGEAAAEARHGVEQDLPVGAEVFVAGRVEQQAEGMRWRAADASSDGGS